MYWNQLERAGGVMGDSFITEANISPDIISTFNAERRHVHFQHRKRKAGGFAPVPIPGDLTWSLTAPIRTSCWAMGTQSRKLPLPYLYLVPQITPHLYQMATTFSSLIIHILHFWVPRFSHTPMLSFILIVLAFFTAGDKIRVTQSVTWQS